MMRIGTVGTGFIVDGFIDAVSKTENVMVTSVFSRTEETARAFAAKHNLTNWHTDREAFLNDPEVDVVYVASPNSLHFQWSLDALQAGAAYLAGGFDQRVEVDLPGLVARDRGAVVELRFAEQLLVEQRLPCAHAKAKSS